MIEPFGVSIGRKPRPVPGFFRFPASRRFFQGSNFPVPAAVLGNQNGVKSKEIDPQPDGRI
jgi:hypothetical protein